ncbi:group I intron endonuclease [compost metagenome]|nr:MAG TPA: intron associated endonuclease [Caudoviricetes sp.]
MITLTKGPGIYRITDASSGRFYIGGSVNVAKRWSQHLGRLKCGTHPNPILQRIWNKDPARLQIEMICECTRDTVLAHEQTALDAAGVGKNCMCMNVLVVAGSPAGRKRTEATRRAMSLARLGKRPSAETRAKQRAAKLGTTQTLQHRQNSGNARRGMPGTPKAGIAKPTLRKLTDAQVAALRADRATGMSWRLLAETYDLAKGTAKRIALGITYQRTIP